MEGRGEWMTREEAISVLSCYYEAGDMRQNEAIDMAIATLRDCHPQKTTQQITGISTVTLLSVSGVGTEGREMDDLISRQAAIDTVRRLQTYKLSEGDTMVLIDKADVQTELMVLPAAEPEREDGKWIPCSERTPEVDEDGYSDKVLVSFDSYSGLDIGEYRLRGEKGAGFYIGDMAETFSQYGLKVNAWMPLPPPYREGEQE